MIGRIGLMGLMAAAALSLSACATRHKTYTAPDPAKVNAATKRVEDDLVKARNISREARKFVTDAQKNADRITIQAADLEGKAAILLASVPEELKPQALEILKGIREQQFSIGELSTNLAGAQKKNDDLEQHQTKTDAHVLELKAEQTSYFAKAQELAATATMEREYRIKAEKQLVKEKWIRILWKIGGGFILLLIVGGVILFFMGKLGWALGKIGIKAAV